MQLQDIRALRAQAVQPTRPKTPWLLIAFGWLFDQIGKAPRPLRMPLFVLFMIAAEILPIRILAIQEWLWDELRPETAQS